MIQQTKWVSGPNGGLVSANYAWTSDGQIASIQGPVNAQYTYDAMGRQLLPPFNSWWPRGRCCGECTGRNEVRKFEYPLHRDDGL